MDYGKQFSRPPISAEIQPGSWSALYDKSLFIITATEVTLEYIQKKLGIDLPPTVKIQLFAAGAQIVAGVNTYLEFRIQLPQGSSDIQVIVFDPGFTHGHGDHKLEISSFYMTSKQLFH